MSLVDIHSFFSPSNKSTMHITRKGTELTFQCNLSWISKSNWDKVMAIIGKQLFSKIPAFWKFSTTKIFKNRTLQVLKTVNVNYIHVNR